MKRYPLACCFLLFGFLIVCCLQAQDQPAAKAAANSPSPSITPAIRIDLEKSRERDRKFLRYFTMAHLPAAGVTEAELENHRHALTKLLNCLSWARKIMKPIPIDDKKTIFRIDLRDYRWNDKVWNALIEAYPYTGLDTIEKEMKYCAETTETEMPLMRIDWFLANASKAPLYYDLLQLPMIESELEKQLQLEITENIKQERVHRAGFNNSTISNNSRLIERHDSSNGAFWKTYDFDGTAGNNNLMEYPLGPGEGGFNHAASEVIFTLPNGLHGYYIVDTGGKRMDKADAHIISDIKQPDRTVVAGISCMACHHQGLIEKADQIRDIVQKNKLAFPREETNTVLALYPAKQEMEKLIRDDNERYAQAFAQLNLPAAEKPAEADPITPLALKFNREMDLKRVVAELGTTSEKLYDALDRTPPMGRALGAIRLEGGTIQRSIYLSVLDELVAALYGTEGGSSPAPRKSAPKTAGTSANNTTPPLKGKLFSRTAPIVYLSDLPETDVVNGATPFAKNGKRDENSRIKVTNVHSPKGISMLPNPAPAVASVKYNIGKQAALFKATIAIDDSSGRVWSPAIFSVYGDGKELFKSGHVTTDAPRGKEISVDVAKVDVLELRVQCVGHNHGVHAVWAEPRLLQRVNTPDPGWPVLRKLFGDGPRSYLSDLSMMDVKSGDWPVTQGETGNGKKITVYRKHYPNGIGMHPPAHGEYASATFQLDKKAAVFASDVSLNDGHAPVTGKAVFEVYGDGKKLWESKPISTITPEYGVVNVSGVDKLELRVRVQGNSHGLNAVWMNPRVLLRSSTPDPDAPLQKKLFSEGPREYLTNLKMSDTKSGPWPVSLNGEVGGGKTIVVKGKEYSKGIGMHPPDQSHATTTFTIDKKAAILKGGVSLDDGHGHAWGKATFEIYGDGKKLWTSKSINSPNPEDFEVNVAGVEKIELRVNCDGSSNGVHAVWLNPRILQTKNAKDD